jgi:hypothetical protein
MPEPTTTKLQEWERITSKLLDKNTDYYEYITRNEINLITSLYDENDEMITSIMHQINIYLLDVIDKMMRHYYYNKRLNIYDKIEAVIKLYLAIEVWLQIIRGINSDSNESLQKIIDFSLDKIPYIKKKIRRYLPITNVKVIRLYEIFDKFIKFVSE